MDAACTFTHAQVASRITYLQTSQHGDLGWSFYLHLPKLSLTRSDRVLSHTTGLPDSVPSRRLRAKALLATSPNEPEARPKIASGVQLCFSTQSITRSRWGDLMASIGLFKITTGNCVHFQESEVKNSQPFVWKTIVAEAVWLSVVEEGARSFSTVRLDFSVTLNHAGSAEYALIIDIKMRRFPLLSATGSIKLTKATCIHSHFPEAKLTQAFTYTPATLLLHASGFSPIK